MILGNLIRSKFSANKGYIRGVGNSRASSWLVTLHWNTLVRNRSLIFLEDIEFPLRSMVVTVTFVVNVVEIRALENGNENGN